MHHEPLLAPMAKIERTKTQIEEFHVAVRKFLDATPYKIVSTIYPDADEEVWSFRLTQKLPPDLSVRCGEILHNLRTALEQTLIEVIVTRDNGVQTGIAFPIGKDEEKFRDALRKQEKRLPPDAVPLIEALKPYKGGNNLLWLLHNTNRDDKHRVGLVPVNVRTGGQNSFLSTWDGQALVIGSRGGLHMTCERWVTPQKLAELSGRPTGLFGLCALDPVTGLPNGPFRGRLIYTNHGPGSPEESYEFLTTTPGTKFKTDFQPLFEVAFRDFEAFEREPVANVLHQVRDLVEHTILAFRSRFFG